MVLAMLWGIVDWNGCCGLSAEVDRKCIGTDCKGCLEAMCTTNVGGTERDRGRPIGNGVEIGAAGVNSGGIIIPQAATRS